MSRVVSLKSRIVLLAQVSKGLVSLCVKHPIKFAKTICFLPEFFRGLNVVNRFPPSSCEQNYEPTNSALYDYFVNNNEGPGIWKWVHYFEAYERHLGKFQGGSFNILEIGVYSGGSLRMWLAYFGQSCNIYGVDIEPACKIYQTERVRIFIGDQSDRAFWRYLRGSAPPMHVVIDDGGHTPEQQMVTLEEMLPYMPKGSVYICEDVHGISNAFVVFATGLVTNLNATSVDGAAGVLTSRFQAAVHSIHFYPFLVVIEKSESPPGRFIDHKYGTEWQPFL